MPAAHLIDARKVNMEEYPICGYKNKKHPGYGKKIAWLSKRFAEGLVHKFLVTAQGQAIGGIEYAPAESSWRPVDADGHLVVQCIYSMSKKHQGQGMGGLMLADALAHARKGKLKGVVAITRKGSWMPSNKLFCKHGFEVVDKAPPDFELMVKNFDRHHAVPHFTAPKEPLEAKYGRGLVILTADQCPYLAKCVPEIQALAREKFDISSRVIQLTASHQARENPNPFGMFAILYDGHIIAHNPISKTRFGNIMAKLLPVP